MIEPSAKVEAALNRLQDQLRQDLAKARRRERMDLAWAIAMPIVAAAGIVLGPLVKSPHGVPVDWATGAVVAGGITVLLAVAHDLKGWRVAGSFMQMVGCVIALTMRP